MAESANMNQDANSHIPGCGSSLPIGAEWRLVAWLFLALATTTATPVDAGEMAGENAQGSEGADAPYLETVEVVAPQIERTSTVTLIDQELMHTQNHYVAYDVLKYHPGLHSVQRTGFVGSGLSRLTLRGLGADGPAGLVVLVDGRPDASVSFAHPTPSALHLANIRSIEVIHGPSPVLFGAGLAGVVNIVSARLSQGASGFFRQSFGRFDTSESSAALAYGNEQGYLRLSGSHRETDGYLPELAAEVKSLKFQSAYRLTDRWELAFTAGWNEDAFGVFGNFFVPGPFTDPRTEGLDLTQTTFDLTATGRYSNAVTSIMLWSDDLEPRSQVLDTGEERADVDELGIKAKTEWSFSERTTLTAGFDLLKAETANSPVLPPFGGPGLSIPRERVGESLREYGLYGFLTHELSSRLEVRGGLRIIHHSEYGTESAEELGLVWRLEGGAEAAVPVFRLRYTRGYQSPTLQQLFGVFRAGVQGPANPDLGPERLQQFEAGVTWGGPRWSFDLVAFRQKGKDLISRPLPPPPPPPDIQNSIDFSNSGLEARLRFNPVEGLTLHAGGGGSGPRPSGPLRSGARTDAGLDGFLQSQPPSDRRSRIAFDRSLRRWRHRCRQWPSGRFGQLRCLRPAC